MRAERTWVGVRELRGGGEEEGKGAEKEKDAWDLHFGVAGGFERFGVGRLSVWMNGG